MEAPKWSRYWLRAAAIYNLIWGTLVVLAPSLYFSLLNLPIPTYLLLWQCIGMIVGVFGIGYAIAATNPLKHWAIVLVGLAGKILGPIGFAWAIWAGQLPLEFGWTLITNDLIWWVPFGMILYAAMKGNQDTAVPLRTGDSIYHAIGEVKTESGKSIEQISHEQPVLLVFLRHFGCTFCKESLSYIRQQRDRIEGDGTRIVFVHMATPKRGDEYFRSYGFEDFEQISDPGQRLYQLFKFTRASFGQVFGLSVMWRGIKAGLFGRHGVGRIEGDSFQLPGLALVVHGMVVKVHRYKSASEVPDYVRLASCPMPQAADVIATPPCAHSENKTSQKPESQNQ